MRAKYDQFMEEGSLIVLEGTVLDPMQVYEDLDDHIVEMGYDVRCLGYDPYNAKEFVERWASENGRSELKRFTRVQRQSLFHWAN